MDEIKLQALNFFLKRLSPSQKKELTSVLPGEVISGLEESKKTFLNPFSIESEKALFLIHSSWITPLIRKLPENDMHLMLAALDEETSDKVRSILLLKKVKKELFSSAKKYFLHLLWQDLKSDFPNLSPLSCLPDSDLNSLLCLHPKDLDQLIDLLGIHDLHAEIKQIIETTKLKNIFQSLTKEQIQYLNKLQSQKEKITFKPMHLAKWSGSKAQLQLLLRQRGLNRFAKALFRQSSSLIWYLKHRLAVEEASLMDKLIDNRMSSDAALLLKDEVLTLAASFPKTYFEEMAS